MIPQMPNIPKNPSKQELQSWAAEKLSKCQESNFYGSVTFIFESGRLVRAKTEKSEVPK